MMGTREYKQSVAHACHGHSSSVRDRTKRGGGGGGGTTCIGGYKGVQAV